MKRALVVAIASLFVLSLTAMGSPAQARAARLMERPFAVVAVVDSGINPYHLDFRRPDLKIHPKRYIEGFPPAAHALPLTLGAGSYEEAVARDKTKWDRVRSDELYWIPGTNIVGAIGPFGLGDFRDDGGHGTAVASLAAGGLHGPGSGDVLLVAVEGSDQGLQWAAEQPWIDVITNSWSTVSSDPWAVAAASHKAVAGGKVVCFASGNVAAPLWGLGTQGPSWNINVGAASARTRGEHAYTGYPNDVLGLSLVGAADHRSIDGEVVFSGTSAAAPNMCGLAAAALSDIRAALGDHSEGSSAGLAAGHRFKGAYLKDGCLDRVELEDALQATARPAAPSPPDPEDPNAIPAAPIVEFVRGGYGIVDQDSASSAVDVLLGRTPRPERALEDAWIQRTDSIRNAIWGAPPKVAGCR